MLFATFWGMLLADAKQVLFTFIIAGGILFLSKTKDIIETLKYLIPGLILGVVFLWCVQNVPAFGAFNTWMRPEIYGSDGEATLLKMASLRIIPTFYESPLNMFLGLGPGHTVGRLGGWMLREYEDLLAPLGSSIHPASGAVWGLLEKAGWEINPVCFHPCLVGQESGEIQDYLAYYPIYSCICWSSFTYVAMISPSFAG